MPISGSYFYPGLSAPNSSYPSVDLRGLDSIPPAAVGVGRIFVLSSSKDLYYEDSDGNVVAIAAATGSAVYDEIDANRVINSRGSLTISSSNGVTAVSAAIEFPDSRQYHIRASNSYLILSSSAGSVIGVSGNLDIRDTRSNETIIFLRATTGRIISYPNTGTSFQGGINFDSVRTQIYAGGDGAVAAARWTASGMAIGRADPTERLTVSGNINLSDMATARIYSNNADLIFSASGNSVIALSGVAKFGQYTQSTLPAANPALSGSIVWVSDKKCFAIYGPEGWQRLSSGTL